jgi:hypothetical protein
VKVISASRNNIAVVLRVTQRGRLAGKDLARRYLILMASYCVFIVPVTFECFPNLNYRARYYILYSLRTYEL